MQAWRNGTRSSWRRLSSKSTARSRYSGLQKLFVAVHGHRGQFRLCIHQLSQPDLGLIIGLLLLAQQTCSAPASSEGQCIHRCCADKMLIWPLAGCWGLLAA